MDVKRQSREVKFGAPLKRGEDNPDRWRSTLPGMWAWLWQRISALAIIVLLALHMALPYRPITIFLLFLVVTFHTALGLRVMLLDLGVIHIRYQKALFVVFITLSFVIFAIVWGGIY